MTVCKLYYNTKGLFCILHDKLNNYVVLFDYSHYCIVIIIVNKFLVSNIMTNIALL